MPTWLTTPIKDIWPNLTPEETPRVMRWVDQAERLIAARFRTIQERIDAEELEVAVVGDVVEAMVTRALEDLRRGGMDKLAYPEVSMEWDNSGGAGTGSKLYLTTDELLLLSPPRAESAFTIRKRMEPRW